MKIIFKIISLISIILILCFFSSCKVKYKGVSCNTPIEYSQENNLYFLKPIYKDLLNFNRKVEESGITFYFSKDLKSSDVDNCIDNVLLLKGIVDINLPVYILADATTHINSQEIWINPKDSADFICATLLHSTINNDLPFGFYAGISANLLKDKVSFSFFNEDNYNSKLKNYEYVNELQYPLYNSRYVTKEEYNVAWNFAYKIANSWLNTNTVDNLKNANTKEITNYLSQNGYKESSFKFLVGDNYYPTQILSKNLRLYFAYNYKDSTFTQNEFSLSYKVLRDLIVENEKYVVKTSALYGIDGFSKPLDCFFAKPNDFNLEARGYSYYNKNAVACLSVGVFGHELTRMILYHADSYGYPYDQLVVAYLSSTNLKYSKMNEYICYEARTKDLYFPFAYPEKEVEVIKNIQEFYNQKNGKCNFDSFSVVEYSDCVSYLYSNETYYGHGVSFFNYINNNYGFDAVRDYNERDKTATISGKTRNEVLEEWKNYIKLKYEK